MSKRRSRARGGLVDHHRRDDARGRRPEPREGGGALAARQAAVGGHEREAAVASLRSELAKA
jgi:hypothetical protein